MSKQIEIMGTLARIDGSMKTGQVLVSFTSDVTHETLSMLSISCEDKGEISVPYSPVEQLVALTRRTSKRN